MQVSARHLTSLIFLLFALLAAAWGMERVADGRADLAAAAEQGLVAEPAHVCAFEPGVAPSVILRPDEVRVWRTVLGLGPHGTLDLPLASLWTLFGAVGLAGIGHALAVGGLSILNPYFIPVAWWALLPEMFLADGGWFGGLSARRLWPLLISIGAIARMRPWGRRAADCVSAPRAGRRFLTKKTVVAGGVCWLTAFGVFAAVYPNLAPNRSRTGAAAAESSAVRQARGQGDYVAENMAAGEGIIESGSEAAPEIAALAPPPPAPEAVQAGETASEAESGSDSSGPALPRFDGPSTAPSAGSGDAASSGQPGTTSQPTTAPSTPTTELALAETAPTMPPLSSPWMQMLLSEVVRTQPSTPAVAPTDEPDVSLPAVPLTPADAGPGIVDLPPNPERPLPHPDAKDPVQQEPTDPLPDEEPGPTTDTPGLTPDTPGPTPNQPGQGADLPPAQVPEPGTLGLLALGVIGMARLRRRGDDFSRKSSLRPI